MRPIFAPVATANVIRDFDRKGDSSKGTTSEKATYSAKPMLLGSTNTYPTGGGVSAHENGFDGTGGDSSEASAAGR
jgi:hypothetical protein